MCMVTIKANPDGPLLVEGEGITLIGMDGQNIATKAPFALCRCGKSRNKPFCDGTHGTSGFKSEKVGSEF